MGGERSLVLLAIDTVKQHQSQKTDIAKVQQWMATKTSPTRDELQGATPYLRTMAQHFSVLRNVESLLALKVQVARIE